MSEVESWGFIVIAVSGIIWISFLMRKLFLSFISIKQVPDFLIGSKSL